MTTKSNSSIYTKILTPKNILAEEIIVGYLLSDNTIKKQIINSINSNFFTLKKYQILYLCAASADINNINSVALVIKKLWTKKLLSQAGGISNIIDITQKSQSIFSHCNKYVYIEHLIKILHYYYNKRLFIQYSYSVLQLNFLHGISTKDIYNRSAKYLNIVSKSVYLKNKTDFNNSISRFLQRIHEAPKNSTNILSGFKDLDKITNGFKEGELIIVAGRPSMGKTSFAINITHHLIFKLKLEVHIFSLEMSKEEILDKLLALSSNVAIHQIQSKLITKIEWTNIQEACQLMTSSSLSIDDSNASITYIKSRCKGQTNRKKSITIIDYLQLIQFAESSLESRSQEIGNITRELKLLAKFIKSPIIALSQLNRNVENRANKRPLLSDLRESGCISLFDTGKIYKDNLFYYTEVLLHLNRLYISNTVKNLKFLKTKVQHIYLLISYARIPLHITHNHRLISSKTWQKEDQIKQKGFHETKLRSQLNPYFSIEMNKLQTIRKTEKAKTYDIKLCEYHNFIINTHIVHNSIEQDADLILMLYKNDERLNDQIIDIVIAKHRNGPIGTFQLLFHAETCKFQNIQNLDLLPTLMP